jgi:hypothetical protein
MWGHFCIWACSMIKMIGHYYMWSRGGVGDPGVIDTNTNLLCILRGWPTPPSVCVSNESMMHLIYLIFYFGAHLIYELATDVSFVLCIEMPSYIVYTGRVPGVYDDCEECRRQVHHFSGNSYKGYTTRAEVDDWYAHYLAGQRRERRRNQTKTTFIAMMLIVSAALFHVMVV